MKLRRLIPSVGAIASLVLGLGFATGAAAAPGARTSLFDGKSLKGWTVEKCEAEVQDGNILLKAGNGVVQSEKMYGDYVLELEWKALKPEKWDSGIYFRYTSLPVPPSKRPWPERYQVNLRQGEEGNFVGLGSAKCNTLFKDHAWNKLKLTVRGSRVSLEVNGQKAWEVDGVKDPKGYVALQAEVPGGGQHLFRNIFITEL